MHALEHFLSSSDQLSIMYLDDNKEYCATITAFFKELNIDLDISKYIASSPEQYDFEKYNTLLLNIDFSNLENISMVRQIKSKYLHLHIIVMVETDEGEAISNLYKQATLDYLFKPVEISNLMYILNHIIQSEILKKKTRGSSAKQSIEKKSNKLYKISTANPITALLNGSALSDEVRSLNKKNIAHRVMFLQIDNYSTLEKEHSSEGINSIIAQVSSNLKRNIPNNATLYHATNSDFAILLNNPVKKQCLELAEQIRSYFHILSLSYEGKEIYISMTIGISYSSNADTILEARLALSEAKKNGHIGQHLQYSPESKYIQEDKKSTGWIQRVRRLIENNDIIPYFQPIVNNKTGKIEKYECLARVIDENGHTLSPERFLYAAHATGFANIATKVIVEHSFKAFENTNYELSINISDADFVDGKLTDFLFHKCEKYNISPSRVILEILESNTTEGNPKNIQQLVKLKSVGFKIAIDDFGIGNSNLKRLLNIPFDYIKIDGDFIKNLKEDEKSRKIVAVIVMLAKHLNVKLIAEYVHNKDVFDLVRDFDIDYSQGFYFGRPEKSII